MSLRTLLPAKVSESSKQTIVDKKEELLKLISGETEFINLVHEPELVPPPGLK